MTAGNVNPRDEQVAAALELASIKQLTLINLLRFREIADYSLFPDLDPGRRISGRDAFEVYYEAGVRFVARFGGEVILRGQSMQLIVGPPEERWHECYVVRWPDGPSFLSMMADRDFRDIARHRTAALADSRLIPIVEGA